MTKVMIVDDNPNMVGYIRQMLAPYTDFQVICSAMSIKEAQEVLSHETPDVLFLDFQLPDGDGFDLAPYVKQYHPGLYVVIVTGYYPEIKENAYETGESDYLLKPIDPEELDKVIRRYKKVKKDEENNKEKLTAGAHRTKMENMIALVNINGELCPRKCSDIAFFKYEGRRKMWIAVLENDASMTLRKGTTAKDILLLSNVYQQSHQSFIVNLSLVDTIGNTFVRLRKPFNLYAIPMSRTYQKDFVDRFFQV